MPTIFYIRALREAANHGLEQAWATILHETSRSSERLEAMAKHDAHWKRVSRKIRAQFEAQNRPAP